MFRKSLTIVCVLIIASLVTSGVAAAKPLSSWVKVLDPGDYGIPPIDFSTWPLTGGYGATALETYHDALFAYVASWSGARMFRTYDGMTWDVLTGPGLDVDATFIGGFDMQVYQDRLYVIGGSLYNPTLPKRVLRSSDGAAWEVAHEFALGTGDLDKLGVYKDMIYVTTTFPGTIWRSPSGDLGTWVKVADLGENVAGMPSPQEFKGWFYLLYGEFPRTGAMTLIRSKDGANWETVVSPTLPADPLEYDVDLTVHEGSLYLSTGNFTCNESGICNSLGGKILRSKNGLDWEQVVFEGFGILDNYEMVLYSFQGYLYAITANDGFTSGISGAQVWRSPNGDPGTWELISEPGWAEPALNWSSLRGAQAGFNGELYVAGFSVMAPIWKLER
jgi:hypothetical protein